MPQRGWQVHCVPDKHRASTLQGRLGKIRKVRYAGCDADDRQRQAAGEAKCYARRRQAAGQTIRHSRCHQRESQDDRHDIDQAKTLM